MEGLQAIKPRAKNEIIQSNTKYIDGIERETKSIEYVGNKEGIDVEATLVVSEDDNDESAKWAVENIKFSVKQPVIYFRSCSSLFKCCFLCVSERPSHWNCIDNAD